MTAWTVATLIKIDITYVVWNSTSAHFPWNSIFYFIKMFSYLEMVVVSDSLQHHYKTLWEPLITNISYHPGPGHEVWVSRISPKENPVYFKTYVIQNIRYCYKWIMIQMTNTGGCAQGRSTWLQLMLLKQSLGCRGQSHENYFKTDDGASFPSGSMCLNLY